MKSLTALGLVCGTTFMSAFPVLDNPVLSQVRVPNSMTPAPEVNLLVRPQVSNVLDTVVTPRDVTAYPLQFRPTTIPRLIPPMAINQETLYVRQLCDAIKTRFDNRSVGYQVVVMLPSGKTCEVAGGDARRAPDASIRAMTVNDKITMASVSKTISATALLQLLDQKNISLNTPIRRYLPEDWSYGTNAETITFREILRHYSGIRCDAKGGIALSYAGLKQCLADGVNLNDKTAWDYENTNFALMRVLIPRLEVAPINLGRPIPGGVMKLPAAANWTPEDYANRYIAYVNSAVFKPVGLPALACKVTDGSPALSYKSASANPLDFSVVQAGEIWGDMTLRCASQGWFMSARQLAMFMHGLSQTNNIVKPAIYEQMQDNALGLYWNNYNNGLGSWSHGGFHPAEMNQGEINTVVVGFNNGLSAGVVVNSKFNGSILGQLVQAIQAVAVN